MTYRDEREALHNQVAALEEDLAEARREAAANDEGALREKAAALEAHMAAMRAELARMETELAELRGPGAKTPGRAPGMRALFLVFGALGVLCVIAGVAVKTSMRPSPQPVIAPIQPRPTMPGPDLTELMRKQAEQPSPVATAVAPEPPRQTEARWIARVKRAEGMPLAPGSTCTIDATIGAQGVNAVVDDLVVTCGTKKLYAKTDPLEGMAMTGSDVRERRGPNDNQSRFTLRYGDKGTRGASKNQIDLDSSKGIGLVFSDNLPPFKIELSIPRESEPASALNGK